MAKTPKTDGNGNPIVRKKRAAKAKRLCLLSETPLPDTIQFARNSDEAMDLVDKAQQENKTLYFKRVLMPAPVSKTPVVPTV